MARRYVVLAAFVLSRMVIGFVADNPDIYPSWAADATSDIIIYNSWAEQMQEDQARPYRDFEVEYPPGALPIATVPYAIAQDDYRTTFIAESVAFDALGLLAMYRLARRRNSWWGVSAWLLMFPLLGPVAYLRLDMAVAASLAWALERFEAQRWSAAGLLLGIGGAIKIAPLLLLPPLAMAAPRRWRPIAAAAAGAMVFVIPFATDVPAIYDNVLARNAVRGVHVESIWGSILLLARVTVGATADVVTAFGASDVEAPYASLLEAVSNVLALAVLLASTAFVLTRVRRSDGAHAVLVASTSLMLLTAVGSVLSPQFNVWLVAAMAAALTIEPVRFRYSAAMLSIALALTHLHYPILFWRYLAVEPFVVSVAVFRNASLLAAGVLAATATWRYGQDGGMRRETLLS